MSNRLEFGFRFYVVAAGLAWALAAAQILLVDLARLAPLREALSAFLATMMFSSALWLSGFGACRGFPNWLVALVLVWFLGIGIFMTGAATLGMVPAGIAASFGMALFTVLATVAPPTLGILLLARPPRALLAFERLVSLRANSRSAA